MEYSIDKGTRFDPIKLTLSFENETDFLLFVGSLNTENKAMVDGISSSFMEDVDESELLERSEFDDFVDFVESLTNDLKNLYYN